MTAPIIGLIGHKRAGKDSLAHFLALDHGYSRVAFADPLKAIALDLNPWLLTAHHGYIHLKDFVETVGWEDAKADPAVRHWLQDLGLAIRKYDPDFWVRLGISDASDASNLGTPVVLTDVRFLNEVDAVVGAGGILVRIVRDDADRNAALDPHVSEHELDDIEVDYVIDNNGPLSALRDAAAGLAAAAKVGIAQSA
jgi:hypothetical protein